MPERKQRAVIIGGGPAGALMALHLGQRRFEVDLFEAMDQDEIAGPTIRSWNVVLMGRGQKAFDSAGVNLHEEVGERLITLMGSVRHHAKKKTGKGFAEMKSVCRGDLAKALLDKAQRENINVHFGCSFLDMDTRGARRVATFRRKGKIIESEYDMLVGADGVNSRVRRALEETVPDFTVRQLEDPVAFKTILIPVMGMQDAEESWKTRFHTINSKEGCLIGPPRSDGALSAVILLPSEGRFGDLMKTTQDVRDFFSQNYPHAFGPDGPREEIAKDFLERRPQRLRSLYCSRLANESTVLIGDAAHAMWASLGQGVNAALEDCRVLAAVLDSQKVRENEGREGENECVDIQAALSTYNELRLKDAHAVCALSEEGMGGARSMRPAFAAQLVLITLLNKTLGKLAPKVFGPPSLMGIGNPLVTYHEVRRGVKREAVITKAVFFAGIALACVGAARKAVAKF